MHITINAPAAAGLHPDQARQFAARLGEELSRMLAKPEPLAPAFACDQFTITDPHIAAALRLGEQNALNNEMKATQLEIRLLQLEAAMRLLPGGAEALSAVESHRIG